MTQHLISTEGWRVGAVTLACQLEGKRVDYDVAGWIKGPFGLDFRIFEDSDGDWCNPGFVLTHLPTGYVVRQLLVGSIAEALALADEILAAADWSFIDKPGPAHTDAIKAMKAKHGGVVATGHALIGPRP